MAATMVEVVLNNVLSSVATLSLYIKATDNRIETSPSISTGVSAVCTGDDMYADHSPGSPIFYSAQQRDFDEARAEAKKRTQGVYRNATKSVFLDSVDFKNRECHHFWQAESHFRQVAD